MRARMSTIGLRAGCVVTSSTRSPSIHTSRPSRIESRYSSPLRSTRPLLPRGRAPPLLSRHFDRSRWPAFLLAIDSEPNRVPPSGFPRARRSSMRRCRLALPVLLASLAVAFVATACGGGDESNGGGGEGTTAAAGGGGEAAAPINLAFSTWNGYIGLVIGVEEGFFDEAGVHVEYTVIEDPVQRFNAFKAGRLNAIATTVDTFSRTYAKGIPSVQVLGLDASVGGDGIVAEKDITSP